MWHHSVTLQTCKYTNKCLSCLIDSKMNRMNSFFLEVRYILINLLWRLEVVQYLLKIVTEVPDSQFTLNSDYWNMRIIAGDTFVVAATNIKLWALLQTKFVMMGDCPQWNVPLLEAIANVSNNFASINIRKFF